VESGGTQGFLNGARAGSAPATESLLERLRPRIVLWAAARLSPALRSKVDAEDVAQEILLAIHRDLSSFRGGGERAFYKWVFSIGENRIRDLVDHHAALKRRLPEEARQSTQTSPSGGAARVETCRLVKEAIAALPEDYRRVVQLVRIEERPYEEVAAVLDRSVNAVRILYCRALKALRLALPDTPEMPPRPPPPRDMEGR
jgi:RNA polymerase sigma-70 factor (ECF subfamily)